MTLDCVPKREIILIITKRARTFWTNEYFTREKPHVVSAAVEGKFTENHFRLIIIDEPFFVLETRPVFDCKFPKFPKLQFLISNKEKRFSTIKKLLCKQAINLATRGVLRKHVDDRDLNIRVILLIVARENAA